MTPQNPMEDEEWVYAWAEDLYDEDGQLWVVTMLSIMIAPIYEEMRVKPVLLSFSCFKRVQKD
jgi:hypothetical protein